MLDPFSNGPCEVSVQTKRIDDVLRNAARSRALIHIIFDFTGIQIPWPNPSRPIDNALPVIESVLCRTFQYDSIADRRADEFAIHQYKRKTSTEDGNRFELILRSYIQNMRRNGFQYIHGTFVDVAAGHTKCLAAGNRIRRAYNRPSNRTRSTRDIGQFRKRNTGQERDDDLSIAQLVIGDHPVIDRSHGIQNDLAMLHDRIHAYKTIFDSRLHTRRIRFLRTAMPEPNTLSVESNIDQARCKGNAQVPRTYDSDSLTRHPVASDHLEKVDLFRHWTSRGI